MPIYQLSPVDLKQPDWQSSTHREQGLRNLVTKAIKDAWSEGHGNAGQIAYAVGIVTAVKPDIAPDDAINFVREVCRNTETANASP